MAVTEEEAPASAKDGDVRSEQPRARVRAVRLPSGLLAFLQDAGKNAKGAGAAEQATVQPEPNSAPVPATAVAKPAPAARGDRALRNGAKPKHAPGKPPRGAGQQSGAKRPPRQVLATRPEPGDLVATSINPIPAGAVSGTLTTVDGVRLRYARFAARVQPTRGTVLILQGRAEFIEKYFETAEDLGRRGFCVATFDFRGQGLSQRALLRRRKGHVDDFGEYGLDVEAVMRGLVLPDCPPPYFLLAHSMGSLVALQAATARPNWFERVVLAAPFFGVPTGRFGGVGKAVLTGLDALGLGAAYVPGGRSGSVHLRAFVGNPFTSDPLRYRRIARVLRTAPDLAVGSPTVSWAQAALRAIAETTSDGFAAQLTTPVLAIAAGADRVVDNAAIERFGRVLRVGGTAVLPSAQHEILAERDAFRDLFWAAFDEFVPGASPLA